jgi:hypothetical protein
MPPGLDYQLTEILRRIYVSGVEFSIIGGYAAILHGVSALTRDIDLCVRFTPENLRRIEAAVKDLHPYHRLAANRLPLELTDELCVRLKNLYLQTDLGKLDCLSEVAGIGGFDQVLAESERTQLPFGLVYVVKIEALVAAKEAVGRPHDLRTVAELRAIQERTKGKAKQQFFQL